MDPGCVHGGRVWEKVVERGKKAEEKRKERETIKNKQEETF